MHRCNNLSNFDEKNKVCKSCLMFKECKKIKSKLK